VGGREGGGRKGRREARKEGPPFPSSPVEKGERPVLTAQDKRRMAWRERGGEGGKEGGKEGGTYLFKQPRGERRKASTDRPGQPQKAPDELGEGGREGGRK